MNKNTIKPVEFLKSINNFNGYYISNEGNVYCNLGKGNRRIGKTVELYKIKPRYTKNGYARVYMKNIETYKREDRYIHRLVAENFIPNPENKKYVNHLNCIRNDNCEENLNWATAKENTDQTLNLGHIVRNSLGQFKSEFNYNIAK